MKCCIKYSNLFCFSKYSFCNFNNVNNSCKEMEGLFDNAIVSNAKNDKLIDYSEFKTKNIYVVL